MSYKTGVASMGNSPKVESKQQRVQERWSEQGSDGDRKKFEEAIDGEKEEGKKAKEQSSARLADLEKASLRRSGIEQLAARELQELAPDDFEGAAEEAAAQQASQAALRHGDGAQSQKIGNVQQATSTSNLSQAELRDLVQQVTSKMETIVRGDSTVISLTVKNSILPQTDISLQMVGGSLQVYFHTKNHEAQDTIAKHKRILEERLRAKGSELGHPSVVVGMTDQTVDQFVHQQQDFEEART